MSQKTTLLREIDSKGRKRFYLSFKMVAKGRCGLIRSLRSHCKDYSKVTVAMESTGLLPQVGALGRGAESGLIVGYYEPFKPGNLLPLRHYGYVQPLCRRLDVGLSGIFGISGKTDPRALGEPRTREGHPQDPCQP